MQVCCWYLQLLAFLSGWLMLARDALMAIWSDQLDSFQFVRLVLVIRGWFPVSYHCGTLLLLLIGKDGWGRVHHRVMEKLGAERCLGFLQPCLANIVWIGDALVVHEGFLATWELVQDAWRVVGECLGCGLVPLGWYVWLLSHGFMVLLDCFSQ